jgi:prevent-host-death family protein
MNANLSQTERVLSEAEAASRFEQLLADVRGGVRVVITAEGRPVAVIEPVDSDDETKRERDHQRFMDELQMRGVLNGRSWRREDLYD